MTTKIDWPMMRASVLCALVLAGCDSVKDVQSEPFTPLPPQRGVLQGEIRGLGGGRSITLMYDDKPENAGSFLGAQPSVPTPEPEPVPFTFGSLEAGTAYNVRVTGQPFGKSCVPVSGAAGTIVHGQTASVVIQCTSTVARNDLTVRIPATASVFRALPGAKVILTTGEQMQSKPAAEAVLATGGHYELKFPGALYSAAGQPSPFEWSVSATFTDPQGTDGRCQVLNSAGSNPATHVTTPIVGLSLTQTTSACEFTISGSLAYSTPVGGTAETGTIPGCAGVSQAELLADPDCLVLQVRDVQARPRATYAVSQYGAFTLRDAVTGNPLQFSSTVNSIYDVVVLNHPTGRVCVVGDAGAVSLYRTGTFNPVDITAVAAAGTAANTRAWGTRLNVFCRVRPAPARVLSGTYRPTKWVWTPAPTVAVPNPPSVTVTYDNYDVSKHNAGSNDMLTFYPDGTFLFGTHARVTQALPEAGVSPAGYSAQVEHGFYDYVDADANPATPNGTVRFTLITDTNPTAPFPTAFGTVPAPLTSSAGRNGASGLSSMPGPQVSGTPVAGAGIGIWTAVLNNVEKSTITFGRGVSANQSLSRMTGTFGCTTTPCTLGKLAWELTEPQSVNSEFTGSWISRDHRRFWVWDYLTNYGTHVGVLGGAPSLNAACYTMPDVRVSMGIYTRRGSNTGCYPFDRPATGALFTIGFEQAIDFHLTNITSQVAPFVGVAGLNTATGGNVAGSRLVPQFGTTAAAVLPGFIGRIPGGNTASDGRSPSPTLFLIAPASNFASEVAGGFFTDIQQPAALYFDNLDDFVPGSTTQRVRDFTSWCQTEILGIRTTLNGSPINYPVYLCRTRAN